MYFIDRTTSTRAPRRAHTAKLCVSMGRNGSLGWSTAYLERFDSASDSYIQNTQSQAGAASYFLAALAPALTLTPRVTPIPKKPYCEASRATDSTRRARNQGACGTAYADEPSRTAIYLTGGSVARRSCLNQKKSPCYTYATPPRALVGRWAATRGGQRHVKVNA